jgi:hypothetical protein
MAEYRVPTQQELDRLLYMQGMQGKSNQQIIDENLARGSTIQALPENFFQTASAGARRVGNYVNQAGNLQQIVNKLFPSNIGNTQANVQIPTSFNFAPKQAPTGEVLPAGLQTQSVPVASILQAIKPADVLGISGAERAYGDIGAGKAPQPFDVIDTLGVGAGLTAAGRLAAKGGMATGRYIAPELGNMAEQYAAKTGLLQSVKPIEPVVKGVNTGDEMFVQHNLTADKLIKADRLGGMPVPSLAISKSGAPLDSFGEITLIAPKEFALSSAKNPVYRSDAYTKTSPYTEYKIDEKSQKNLKNMFSDVVNKIPDAEYSFDRVFNNWRYKDDSNIFRAKFLDEQGLLPNIKEFKENDVFNQELAFRIRELQPEYKDWLNNFDNSLPSMGVNVKETIFKGYTPSGNRKYAPADLENIVKEMKGGAGSQNWQGIGQLRAVASPRFRNFSEVKANRDKLLSGEKMKEVKEQSGKAYDDLVTRLYDLSGYRADDALLEVAETRNLSALDRIYGDKITPQLKTDIYTYINKLKDLPTEYFEIKPQRAIDISEFAGAIIPANSPKSVRSILEKKGIQNIYEYSTPEERKNLVSKFGKEMFAAAPIGGGLLGTQQDKRK